MGGVELPIHGSTHRRRDNSKTFIRRIVVAGFGFLLFCQLYLIPAYFYAASPASLELRNHHVEKLNAGLARCLELNAPTVKYRTPDADRINPRHKAKNGQSRAVLLRNATLFDGEKVLSGNVDIVFDNGVIKSVSAAATATRHAEGVHVLELNGQWVTPGLVDMHSHHLVEEWPALEAVSDGNEVHPDTGPLTPQVRSLDGMKASDPAMRIIASGGITTSLILPGSANIMGGEAYPVKNYMQPGEFDEEVVDDLLLEDGIDEKKKRRYLKMACGENPRRVYDHTRMGNAWIFRKQMTRAKAFLEKQNAWCLSAAAAQESGDQAEISTLSASVEEIIHSVEALELDSTMAMLRGKININQHCYTPGDMETALRHSHEFGFRVAAFHHSLSAWKVPELLKREGDNITIATFSDFGLYKKEAYDSNLYAGKILADNGVNLAYKSDHSEGELNAKYLIFQAATGHSFGLSRELALRSVTSVPAKSIEQDHRIGYTRPGYDADLVIWDSDPLSVGSTPLQVYIDGRETLDPEKVKETLDKTIRKHNSEAPESQIRSVPPSEDRDEVCTTLQKPDQEIVITGIRTSFLDETMASSTSKELHTMILKGGKIACFGSQCVSSSKDSTVIALKNGYVAPGLTALSSSLGLTDIDTAEETADGRVSNKVDPTSADNVDYAKYGVHFDGRAFARARFGGVTRAVTSPLNGGFLGGVSTGLKTSGKKSALNGGIFKDDVALHFVIGQQDKATDATPTVSGAIGTLRKILIDSKEKDSIYGRVANGSLPLLVHVENKYDIVQLIKVQKDLPQVKLVVVGGAGAPAVATELAEAKIPVILAPFRASPDHWEKGVEDTLTGPPLTRSSADVLTEAGVFFGIAIGSALGDARIQNTFIEASWAAKYSGLDKLAAVNLVSRNIEKILGLDVQEETRDFVVYEGDPLQFGASVVLTVDGDDREVVACWPEVQ